MCSMPICTVLRSAMEELTRTSEARAGGAAMRHVDYRTLIDRGRKAGLGTSELYRALAVRRPEAQDGTVGQTDGNGFVSSIDPQGQRVYLPFGSSARS